MEVRMSYTSSNQYLEMSRQSAVKDPGLDLFYAQLLDGSPWNPPYAGVVTPQNPNVTAAELRSNVEEVVPYWESRFAKPNSSDQSSVDNIPGLFRGSNV